jgi:cytochrome c oxidase subunit IV
MSAEHTHEEGSTPKKIWKTFWILLAITVCEIIYAVTVGQWNIHRFPDSGKIINNLLYVVLSAAKAGFIISEFMHMKYEVKNLVRTVGLPCLLLIWLVTALIWEGGSWRKMMNKPKPAGAEYELTAPSHPDEPIGEVENK